MDFFELFYRDTKRGRGNIIRMKWSTYSSESMAMLLRRVGMKKLRVGGGNGIKGLLFKVYLLRKKFHTTLMSEKEKMWEGKSSMEDIIWETVQYKQSISTINLRL